MSGMALPEYLAYCEAHAKAAEVGHDLKTAELVRRLVAIIKHLMGWDQTPVAGE